LRKEAAQKQRQLREDALRSELNENRMRGKTITAVPLDFQHRAEFFRYTAAAVLHSVAKWHPMREADGCQAVSLQIDQ